MLIFISFSKYLNHRLIQKKEFRNLEQLKRVSWQQPKMHRSCTYATERYRRGSPLCLHAAGCSDTRKPRTFACSKKVGIGWNSKRIAWNLPTERAAAYRDENFIKIMKETCARNSIRRWHRVSFSWWKLHISFRSDLYSFLFVVLDSISQQVFKFYSIVIL